MKTPNLMSVIIIFASFAGIFGAAGAARQDPARAAIAEQARVLMAAIGEGDFAHGDAAPMASPAVSDRVGLPADYARQLRQLGVTAHDDHQGLTTVYANDRVVSVANTEAAHYPNGSVLLMEFAEPLRDGEGELLRDARGQPLKGSIRHIDVMRRDRGFGESYGASRAGEWEFASYAADGSTLVAPTNAAHCAACHLKAGADKDFVFRQRSWGPSP